MSQHFLLDGYNIIKQTPSLNHGTLESQRLALVSWIKIHQPQGSRRNAITIVFDGKQEFYSSFTQDEVQVIFTQGQSADDLIKHIVETKKAKDFVVVSDDKDIKLYVRALGASVLSVKEFISVSLAKSNYSVSKANKQGQSSKYISLTDQTKINKELEKIWIKQKNEKSLFREN